MRNMIYWLIPLSVMLLLVTTSCASGRRKPIGVVDGKLALCPKSPNCVSSEERGKPCYVEPFECMTNPATSWKILKQVIEEMGGKVEKESDDYLWATFRTRIFRFVDDVEFRLGHGTRTIEVRTASVVARVEKSGQVIHVRSASRTGYSDFGVNRRRIGKIRSRYDELRSK